MYINPFISLEKDIKNGNASEENYIMGETERTLAAVICEIIKQVYKRGLRTCIDIDKRNEHTNIYTGENSSSYNHTYRTENFYADNVKDDFYGLTGEVLEKLQRDYAYVQNYKDYVKQGHVNSSFTDNVRNYEVNIGSVDIESAGMMEHIAANIGNEDIESMGSIERRESYVENAGIMEHRKADAENADTMEHREADAENADIIKHSENNIENINIPEHREVNIDSADKVFSNVTEYNSNNENTDIVEYREANVENMNIMEQSIADIVHEDFTEHRVADTAREDFTEHRVADTAHEDFTEHRVADTAHEDFTEHCGADIVNIDTADAAYNSMDEHGTDIENVTAHQSITGAAAILDTDINYTDNTTNVAADMHILNMNVLNTAAINGHTENEKSVNNVLGGYTENKNTENKNTENNVLNRYVENRYTENKNTENINKVNRNITDEIIVHKNTENSNIENEYTVSADIENAVYDDALTFNKYLDITESFILNELRRRKNIRIIDNSVDTNAIDSDTINENADRDNVNSGNTAQYDEKNINTANDISISSGVNQNEEMTLLHIDNKEELQRLEELLSYEFGGVNNLSKLEKNNVTDSRIISGKPINNSVTENNITEKSFTENSIAESSITENSISEHKVIENNPAVIDLKTTYEAEQSESVNENTIRNTIESIHGNINQNRTGNISQSHNIIVPSETKADAEYDEEYIFFTRAVEYLAQSQAMEEYKKSSSGLNAAGTLSTIATMETAYTPDYGNGTAAGREIVTGRIIAAVTETGEQIGAANVELTLPFSQEDTGEISGDGSYRTGQTENRVKTIDNEKLTRIDESSISSAADISNYSYSDGRHGTDSEEYIGRSIGERVNNIIDSRINKISEKVYSQLEHRLENERRRRGR